MKKIRKFFKSPAKFISDSYYYRQWRNRVFGFKDPNKTAAIMFHLNDWKKFMWDFLPEYNLVRVPFRNDTNRKTINYYRKTIEQYKDKVFFIWGYNEPEGTLEYAAKHNIKCYRMEDGFLRSVKLGAEKSQPISLCIDSKGLYFDATQASELEDILNEYDFANDGELMREAKACKELLLDTCLSKYNNVSQKSADEIYGTKLRKRVLVIGQVEDDASIRLGCAKRISNNDLVLAAVIENPHAEIIYKPHPDVLLKKRKNNSDPDDIRPYAKVIDEPLSLPDALKTIDEVYTISSLAGFEALLRGIKVTCFGNPFYSGWGLTNDKQPNLRRKRALTIDEVFAGSYILYAKYFSLVSRERISLRQAIAELSSLKASYHNKPSSVTIATVKDRVKELKNKQEDLRLRELELDVKELELKVKYKEIELQERYAERF